MKLSDIDYDLPEWAIAQSALEPRDAARLLVCENESIDTEKQVRDLPWVLRRGDLLVVNETRVIRSRVMARRARGGRVEVFFVAPIEECGDGWWEVLVKPSRRIRVGELVSPELSEDFLIQVGEDSGRRGRRRARFMYAEDKSRVAPDTLALLEQVGEMPLPPYFKGVLDDDSRYQTVYARTPGSAAAPTAGLHFTPELIETLQTKGIDIATVDHRVGADTFLPVISEDPRRHEMHVEQYRIPEKTASMWKETTRRGGRVIAVGTTSLRALESAFGPGAGGDEVRAGSGVSDLMVAPGYRFVAIDGLMTNFHAPRTTMIMLLASIYPRWREAYEKALSNGFRFLSFGDSMLVIGGGRRLPTDS